MKSQLLNKIATKQAVIGIYGLGYVGLPLAIRFAECGFNVIGFDIDENKISLLDNGKTYLKHIPDSKIKCLTASQFSGTTNFSRSNEVDVLILCVPTPLNQHREPDLSYVINTLESALPYLKEGQLLSLESTTYPGTTEEQLAPRLKAKGYILGENYFLAYSPEREDPGNEQYSTQTIPKVVGAITEPCLAVASALYNMVIDQVVPVSSTKVAEFTKILENIHRAVNIGLVNEMKIVADRMDIDIHEVISAAKTKPFGFTPYYPGPGLGGHCIPIDPFYLTWKAREYGINTRFIELAGEINTSMPAWVISKVSEALNDHQKSIKGSRILILGVSYKKNIDDMRESPSMELIQLLQKKGALVDYSDPLVAKIPPMRRYQFKLTSQDINPEMLSSYDCLLIATDHDAFDYPMILEHAKLIVDTRGRYSNHTHDKVINA